MSGECPVFIAAGPDIMEAVLKLIENSGRLSLAGTAQNGEEFLKKAVDSGAKVFVIDFALPQISGVKVTEYLSVNCPDKISVLVSDQSNLEFFRSAMLAGAREFIVLPVSANEFEFALERVVQVAGTRPATTLTRDGRPQNDGRVVVASSGKGGVGLSFIAANLAKLIADEIPTLSVALVDLNYQANDLAAIFDCEPRATLQDLAPVIAELDPALTKAAAHNLTSNLHLLAAPPEEAVRELFSPDQIRALIEALRSSYDLILIDNGAFLRGHGCAPFELADLVLVVLTGEVLSVRGSKRLIDSLERLGISKNTMLAVINRWGLFGLPPERIAEFIGVAVGAKMPESDLVRTLMDEGRFIETSDRTEVGAAFEHLALVLKERLSIGEGLSVH